MNQSTSLIRSIKNASSFMINFQLTIIKLVNFKIKTKTIKSKQNKSAILNMNHLNNLSQLEAPKELIQFPKRNDLSVHFIRCVALSLPLYMQNSLARDKSDKLRHASNVKSTYILCRRQMTAI